MMSRGGKFFQYLSLKARKANDSTDAFKRRALFNIFSFRSALYYLTSNLINNSVAWTALVNCISLNRPDEIKPVVPIFSLLKCAENAKICPIRIRIDSPILYVAMVA